MLSASRRIVYGIESGEPAAMNIPVESLVRVVVKLVTESVPCSLSVPVQEPATSAVVRVAGTGGVAVATESTAGASSLEHAAMTKAASRKDFRMGPLCGGGTEQG